MAPGSWLDGRALEEARPAEEGVPVLGIASPNGDWFGTPAGHTRLAPEDTRVVYGRSECHTPHSRKGRRP